MSSDIKETIQKQLDEMTERLQVLRGNRTTLEQQLRDTERQIIAFDGAIEVSKMYLKDDSKVVEIPTAQVEAINEEAIEG